MNNSNIDLKLTPSAKEALSELTKDYRKSLLERAFSIAQERDTANKEISLRDILEAQQPIKYSIEKGKYLEYKRKRWTMLMSLSGAVYAVAGILIYLYQNKKFSLEKDLGLIIAILGILITLVAYLYGQFLTRRLLIHGTEIPSKPYSRFDSYDIVKRWQIIEQLTTSIMKLNSVSNSKSNSVNQVIRYLTENFASNDKEFMEIRELLQTRNRILHEGYSLSEDESRVYITIADNLIEKLEHANK